MGDKKGGTCQENKKKHRSFEQTQRLRLPQHVDQLTQPSQSPNSRHEQLQRIHSKKKDQSQIRQDRKHEY